MRRHRCRHAGHPQRSPSDAPYRVARRRRSGPLHSARSPAAATTSPPAVRDRPGPGQDHRRHHRGRRRRPRTASASRSRSASRSSWSSRPTRRARSTCTPTRSRSSSTARAPPRCPLTDRQARHRRRRVARPREDRSSSSRSSSPGAEPLRLGDPRPRDRRLRRTSRSRLELDDRGRRRGADGQLHGPRRRLAHAALRRRHERPPGAGVAGRGSSTRRRFAVAARVARLRDLRSSRRWPRCSAQDRLTNPIFGIFYVWWWVGLVPLSLLLGPVYKAISPVRTINAAFAKLSGSDPDKGVFTYPERLGYWPAALGPLRVRLAGAGLPVLDRARPGAAVVRGVRRGDAASAARCSAARSTSAPTRSRSTRRWSASCRSGGAAAATDGTAGWSSAARSRTSTPSRSDRGWSRWRAVLFGSTAFDSFKDSTLWIKFIQGNERSRATARLGRRGQQPGAARLLRRRRR